MVPIVYQDSTLVISLITKGGGTTRTKHLRARMYQAKESIDEGRTSVLYLSMKVMPSEGASKVLKGKAQENIADYTIGVTSLNG